MVSDAELVIEAQRGDVAGMGILLERHHAAMYARALGILGNSLDAQDAVQETFLVAMRRIGQVREPASIGGWLHAVLRSACYTQIRGSRPALSLDAESAQAVPTGSEESAEALVDRIALQAWVWTAIRELPEPLRVTAMLRYFGTHSSYDDIAAILGIPTGTVRSRLHAARIRLADALLMTATTARDDARAHAEAESRFFVDALEQYNVKRDYSAWLSPLAPDLVWVYADGIEQRHAGWPRRVAESDLEAGMRMVPTNIIAGRDVTVLELAFLNPPETPSHCPPSTTIVYFYREGQVHLLRQHYTSGSGPS